MKLFQSLRNEVRLLKRDNRRLGAEVDNLKTIQAHNGRLIDAHTRRIDALVTRVELLERATS